MELALGSTHRAAGKIKQRACPGSAWHTKYSVKDRNEIPSYFYLMSPPQQLSALPGSWRARVPGARPMSHRPGACSFQHHKEAQDGGGHADLANHSLGRPHRGTGVVLGLCPHPHPDPAAPRTHGRWLRLAAAPPCRRPAAPARALPASRASAGARPGKRRGGGVELRRGSVEVRAAAVLQIPCACLCTWL